jgi:hypothetical protein
MQVLFIEYPGAMSALSFIWIFVTACAGYSAVNLAILEVDSQINHESRLHFFRQNFGLIIQFVLLLILSSTGSEWFNAATTLYYLIT